MKLSTIFWTYLASVRPCNCLTETSALRPSEAAVERNAFQIFNAVHSAMRQWGSSLNHNGMSFFLARVPEGQLFYHGCQTSRRQTGFDGIDWLAFEIVHAQEFARSSEEIQRPPGRPPRKDPPRRPPQGLDGQEAVDAWRRFFDITQDSSIKSSAGPDGAMNQKPLTRSDDDDPYMPKPHRGYLHTYRAARDLNVLYIDGMAAGKSNYGTLDSQDHILRDCNPSDDSDESCHLFEEFPRAKDLCQLADDWAGDGFKIDGFVRMEAGYEIIYCDFSEGAGLDLVSIRGSPFRNESSGYDAAVFHEWLPAAAARYHGMPEGRVETDWSSMVSAFFYDVNLTNPDGERPELPRMGNVVAGERAAIRERVGEVVKARRGTKSHVDWQGIVDLIVTRYSGRLTVLANSTVKSAIPLVGVLLGPFIAYAETNPVAKALERCTGHFLDTAVSLQGRWTPEDRLVYLAIKTVSREICSTFIQLHDILGGDDDTDEDEETAEKAQQAVRELMGKLQWTTWKECGPCSSPEETCFVAMFPIGSVEDHYAPSCKTPEASYWEDNYWRFGAW